MKPIILILGILILIPIIYLMGIKGMTFDEMKNLILDRVSPKREE